MHALTTTDIAGAALGLLALWAICVVIILRRRATREARERREQLRARDKLRREFWGYE